MTVAPDDVGTITCARAHRLSHRQGTAPQGTSNGCGRIPGQLGGYIVMF